jgi:hypothetical protein
VLAHGARGGRWAAAFCALSLSALCSVPCAAAAAGPRIANANANCEPRECGMSTNSDEPRMRTTNHEPRIRASASANAKPVGMSQGAGAGRAASRQSQPERRASLGFGVWVLGVQECRWRRREAGAQPSRMGWLSLPRVRVRVPVSRHSPLP